MENSLKITITVADENLNYTATATALSFERAIEEIASLEKNYNRRVEMELDKGDVMAEQMSEEERDNLPF